MPNSLQDFRNKINKESEGSSYFVGDSLNLSRFSSGSIELDIALGGGYPIGRMILLFGAESSGKSYLSTKACVSAQNYCFKCNNPLFLCDCKKHAGGSALYVDLEGSLDKEWALKQGFDFDKHLVYIPDYGEQAVDIITNAIMENLFDVIVLDSIAQMVPQAELEDSTETTLMPLQAKLMNRAFRKWQSAISKAKKLGYKIPTMLFINQPRYKFVQFGDNVTLPGGQAQHFYPSIKIRLKNQKVHSIKSVIDNAYQEVGGVIVKNKTHPPKQEFTFHLALKDYDYYKAGAVNNSESMVKYGRRSNFIHLNKKKWCFDFGKEEIEAGSKEELIKRVEDDPEIYNYLYQVILNQECG